MLGKRNAMATIAVKDINAAKKFYEEKLGLQPLEFEEASVITYKSGNSTVLVYQSQYAGTDKATAATWSVGDNIESVVEALKAKGISFEHYDFPNSKLEGDVHVMGKMKAAWFKDPDGNIINLAGQ
jgi:catechol 2,3-dioxygenase-like lactoylglutathione lyase family enzyme